MTGWYILSTLTFLPLVGALFIWVIRGDDDVARRNIRATALAVTVINFLLSLLAWSSFDPGQPGFQLEDKVSWLGGLMTYHMGVDGISMPFVMLTAAIMPLCIIASWHVTKRVKEYMIAFLVLETLMIGVFCALDLVLFYLFFEGALIPMFLIIGIWGGARRIYAAFKFFLYTLAGSVLMLLAIMAIYCAHRHNRHCRDPFFKGLPGVHADLVVAGLLRIVRGEDADVAGAYLAARCPRRGANGRLCRPGRHLAEDGRIRLPAVLAAHVPAGVRDVRADDVCAVCNSDRLHLARGAHAGRHEEADRLFVGRPHGLRDHGHLLAQQAGH
jgi:hypothetical protein